MKLAELLKQNAKGANREAQTNEYPLESRQLSARISPKTYAALDLMARSSQNESGNENKTTGVLMAEIIEKLLDESGMFEAMDISEPKQDSYTKERKSTKDGEEKTTTTEHKYSYVEARWNGVESELYGTSQKPATEEDEGN